MACSPVPCSSQMTQPHTGVWRRGSEVGEDAARVDGGLWHSSRSQAEADRSLRPTVRRQADSANSNDSAVENVAQSFPMSSKGMREDRGYGTVVEQ